MLEFLAELRSALGIIMLLLHWFFFVDNEAKVARVALQLLHCELPTSGVSIPQTCNILQLAQDR